ncbi:MAG: bifunctional homocysteine S-methyltransferase/methylenetetrahydrofolate reductase [Gemmatimonadetes bacterium]|nr:bifunctional homocysteine S-methyltransferase/methylenetetrahydrofolate reductase [Gemmatimonadota bacterium]
MKELKAMIEDGEAHVLDGAMGTLLYDRGVFVNVCYDELSLTRPGLVEEIHREYVAAGAEILETNTFGANPVKLSGFGLEEKTEEINRAAAELARRAAGSRARVVGAIGPLGIRIEPWGPTSEDEAGGYFRRQAAGLLTGGVDGFLLETFSDVNEMRQAIGAVRSVSDRPIFAQITIDEGGATSYGTDVEDAARSLDEWGADVIGVNCSVGPAEILDAMERIGRVTERPLIAQPNAGLPRLVGDRKIYLASPGYMARYAVRMVEAGVRFVGGCCGTTPQHVREIRTAVDGLGGRATVSRVAVQTERGSQRRPFEAPPGFDDRSSGPSGSGREAAPLSDRSGLGRRLAAGEFVVSVELLPPRGWDPSGLVSEASRASEAGVDIVSVVDSARGPARMGAMAASTLLLQGLDAEVLVQYTCRDRTMARMISDLLGAAASGIRNVLVVSGDPILTGPYPDPTALFDIDSIGLTNVIHYLNRGVDPGGHAVVPPTRFVVGVALHPGAADMERELSRYRWKVEAGADFAITQPIFDPSDLLPLVDATAARAVPLIAGLWPLASLRNAEYLAQEVPGVRVPAEVLTRMERAEERGGDAAAEEGVKIVEEILDRILPHVQGVHVSGHGGDLELQLRIAREVRARSRELGRAR